MDIAFGKEIQEHGLNGLNGFSRIWQRFTVGSYTHQI